MEQGGQSINSKAVVWSENSWLFSQATRTDFTVSKSKVGESTHHTRAATNYYFHYRLISFSWFTFFVVVARLMCISLYLFVLLWVFVVILCPGGNFASLCNNFACPCSCFASLHPQFRLFCIFAVDSRLFVVIVCISLWLFLLWRLSVVLLCVIVMVSHPHSFCICSSFASLFCHLIWIHLIDFPTRKDWVMEE